MCRVIVLFLLTDVFSGKAWALIKNKFPLEGPPFLCITHNLLSGVSRCCFVLGYFWVFIVHVIGIVASLLRAFLFYYGQI
jgi:hypothetical protein